MDYVHRIEHKSWTNVGIFRFYSTKASNCWICITHYTFNACQLFRVWFWRRIILLFAITDLVCGCSNIWSFFRGLTPFRRTQTGRIFCPFDITLTTNSSTTERRLIRFPTLFLFRLPFDWKTPFGYPVALLCQTLAVYASILCVIPCICNVIGSSWIFTASINDICNDLPLLIVGGRSLQNRENTKKRFCKFVQFYLDSKELSVKKSIQKILTISNRHNDYFFSKGFCTHTTQFINL